MLSFQENHTVNQMGYPTSWQSIVSMLNKNTSSINYSALSSFMKCSLPSLSFNFLPYWEKKLHLLCTTTVADYTTTTFSMIYEVLDSGFKGLTTKWQQATEPCSQKGFWEWWDHFFFIYMNRVEQSKQQKSYAWHK